VVGLRRAQKPISDSSCVGWGLNPDGQTGLTLVHVAAATTLAVVTCLSVCLMAIRWTYDPSLLVGACASWQYTGHMIRHYLFEQVPHGNTLGICFLLGQCCCMSLGGYPAHGACGAVHACVCAWNLRKPRSKHFFLPDSYFLPPICQTCLVAGWMLQISAEGHEHGYFRKM
jgi:hypothetical protein